MPYIRISAIADLQIDERKMTRIDFHAAQLWQFVSLEKRDPRDKFRDMALARLTPTMPEGVSDQNCRVSLRDPLQRYIETGPPSGQEEDARRRGLRLLSQIDIH